MKKIFLFGIYLSFMAIGYSQNWVNSAGSLYNDESYDVEIDDAGNIYATGYTTAQSVFGGNISINTNGFSDVFVSKSHSNGNFQWVKVFGGANADRGYDLTLDNQGNIYITGYFQGTANFDSFTLTSQGSQDIFLVKLDNNGNVLWAISEGGTEGDTGYGVAVDGQGNVVLTGQFKGSASIGPNTFNSAINPNTSQAEYDIFLSKYDANGNDLWSIQGSAKYDDRGLALAIDNSDNILLTGQFSDTLTLAGNTFNNSIYNAGMLVKFNPNGNLTWFKRMGAVQTLVYDLEIDSQDNVFVTGDFQGQLMILDNSGNPNFLTGNYQYRIFLIKFNEAGEVLWMQEDDSDSEVSSKAISMDANGDLYLAGTFKCVMNEYADSLGDGYFNSVGFNDVFITKYSNSGTRQWMKQYGGPYDDYCSGIAVDQYDNPVISGGYSEFFNYPKGSSFQNFSGINSDYYPFSNCQQFPAYGYLNSRGNKDIFIGKPVDLLVDPYYYYYNNVCGNSSNPCMFSNCLDSVEFCVEGLLQYVTFTIGNGNYQSNISSNTNSEHYGPYFDFSWNNGGIHDTTKVNTSGTYTINSNRIDGCSQHTDSIDVTIHQLPPLPLLSDSLGFNTNSLPYNDITVCDDTVFTWISDLDSNFGLFYATSEGLLYDTLVHGFTQGGYFSISVLDSATGCQAGDGFHVNIEYPEMDTLVPYIVFEDVDSICLGDYVHYVIADSLTNPNGDFQAFCSDAILIPQKNCLNEKLAPTTTGWHTVSHSIVLGYDNSCGMDTVRYTIEDSIYIVVSPVPNVTYSLSGNALLCPGDSVLVWTSDTFPNFTWNGNGIQSINAGGDTISVNLDGNYSYSGQVVDSVSGCTNTVSEHFHVNYKQAATIVSNVPDNIICPGDSIQLTCIDAGIGYTWVGPQGNTIGNTQSIWVNIPGFYHCILADTDSCILTSNTIELKEFNTPYIMAEPGTELCHSGAIELMAVYNGSPAMQWLPPINSTDSVIVVSQPGTYYLEVAQCGVTILDSIIITSANIDAEITVLSDTLLCPGDTAVLMANSGMAIYEWTPAFYGQTVQTTSPGDYVVTITDGATGCTATSDTVTVAFHPGGQIPDVDNITACLGDSALLINQNQNVTTQWFLNDTTTTPITSNDSLWIANITSDTIIYVENFDTNCWSNRVPVYVNLSPVFLSDLLPADSSICEGSNMIIDANITISGINVLWQGPNGFSSNQNTVSISQASPPDSGYYYLTLSDNVCLNSDSILIDVLPSPTLDIIQDTVLKCIQDTILLETTSSFGDISWGTGDTTSSIQVVLPGTYIAFLTDSNGCASLPDTAYVQNTLSPHTVFIDTVLCSGEVFVYPSSSGDTIAWFNTVDSMLLVNPVFTSDSLFSSAVFYGISEDTNGCFYIADELNITINPINGNMPIQGDTTVCLGSNVNLQTSFFPGATYEWTHNGNQVSNNQFLSFTADSFADSGIYVLTVSGLACINPVTEVSIVVYDVPDEPIIYGDTTYCENDTLILFTDSSAAIMTWSTPWGQFTNQDTLIQAPMTNQNGVTVILVATDSNLCSSPTSEVTIEINQSPQAPILNNSSYCVGDDIYLSSQNAFGNVAFEWADESSILSTFDTLTILNSDTSNTGTYYLTITDNNGCISMDSAEIAVNSYPIVDLNGDSLVVCIEDIPGFELEVNDGYDSYTWQDGSSNYYYAVQDSGWHFVSAEVGSCDANDSIYISLDTCTITYLAPNVITPNGDGVNDLFTIDFEFDQLLIFNRWGEVVFESSSNTISWDGNDTNGNPVAEGVYFYVIEAGERVQGNVQVLR